MSVFNFQPFRKASSILDADLVVWVNKQFKLLQEALATLVPSSVAGATGLLADPQPVNLAPTANVTIPANYALVAVHKYSLAAGVKVSLGSGAILRIL